MLTTNPKELELFRASLRAAIVRDHAVLPRIVGLAHLFNAGDWVRLSSVAYSLAELAEEFADQLCKVAVRQGALAPGERLFPDCPVCGGSWCSAPLAFSDSAVEFLTDIVIDNKNQKEE
jgi:hypothetical protein